MSRSAQCRCSRSPGQRQPVLKAPISAIALPSDGTRIPRPRPRAILRRRAVRLHPLCRRSASKKRKVRTAQVPARSAFGGLAGVAQAVSDGLGATAAAWSWPASWWRRRPTCGHAQAWPDTRPRSPGTMPGAEGLDGAPTVKALGMGAVIWGAVPGLRVCRRSSYHLTYRP